MHGAKDKCQILKQAKSCLFSFRSHTYLLPLERLCHRTPVLSGPSRTVLWLEYGRNHLLSPLFAFEPDGPPFCFTPVLVPSSSLLIRFVCVLAWLLPGKFQFLYRSLSISFVALPTPARIYTLISFTRKRSNTDLFREICHNHRHV